MDRCTQVYGNRLELNVLFVVGGWMSELCTSHGQQVAGGGSWSLVVALSSYLLTVLLLLIKVLSKASVEEFSDIDLLEKDYLIIIA